MIPSAQINHAIQKAESALAKQPPIEADLDDAAADLESLTLASQSKELRAQVRGLMAELNTRLSQLRRENDFGDSNVP